MPEEGYDTLEQIRQKLLVKQELLARRTDSKLRMRHEGYYRFRLKVLEV